MSELFAGISTVQWYVVLGIAVAMAGTVRLLLIRDLVSRLIAMNVVGAGSLLILIALAARSQPIDPVLSALVITGLVITVAFTGVGAVLIRRIESHAPGYREAQFAEGSPAQLSPQQGGEGQ